MISPVGMSEVRSENLSLSWDPETVRDAIHDPNRAIVLVRRDAHLGIADLTDPLLGDALSQPTTAAILPRMPIDQLGDATFRSDHGLQWAYLTGAMANGIGSCEIVEAMGQAGMLGFFGAAGLSLERIEAAIGRLRRSLAGKPFGFNLIHSPGEPAHEAATVDLYLRHGVRLIEASAYLDLTPPVVRYRVAGIHRAANGEVITPNRVIAKVSRVEVARKFLAPPPERLLRELVSNGQINVGESELARQIPMAQDVTVEADSGGHTDNRPLVALLPTMLALRDQLQREHGFAMPLRVGAAGGISTPASVAAAFAMGAAYVVTGSVNQACVESGSSDAVRQMLAEAEQADVTMAPAADMFEMGVKLQVLKRGTMFPMRAQKLYDLYRGYPSLEAIPAADRDTLERTMFRASVDEIWRQTLEYWQRRDPSQVERAHADPKHRMALVFRWYLGQSSRWANAGVPDRKIDYQVWCGPAMGAFNEWTRGTPLERPEQRRVVTVARALMHGAAVTLRLAMLRAQGVRIPSEWAVVRPVTG